MLNACLFMPHPPLAVPGVGGEAPDTLLESYRRAAEIAKHAKPDIVVVISPHGDSLSGNLSVHTAPRWSYSFDRFGARNVKIDVSICPAFTSELLFELGRAGVNTVIRPGTQVVDQFDHGAAVPLYFVCPEVSANYVLLTPGGHDSAELSSIGAAIRRLCDRIDSRVLILASGDMSHYLSDDGPYGYSADGEIFDKKVCDIFHGDVRDYIKIDRATVQAAGQCAFEPWSIALNAIGGSSAEVKFIGYEAPFGVGYLTAAAILGEQTRTTPDEPVNSADSGAIRVDIDSDALARPLDPYCTLARAAVFNAVCHRREPEYRKLSRLLPSDVHSTVETTRAGAFVSLHKRGNLRGCIGVIEPVHPHLGDTICYCASQAALGDPRFEPVDTSELFELDINIDVLGEPESIDSIQMLDVRRYGVIVTHGRRRGLLLPDIEGVDTPEYQVEIALNKAGISPNAPYTMERFEVVRHLTYAQ